jgi:long-chain acyl-CoA synthetase
MPPLSLSETTRILTASGSPFELEPRLIRGQVLRCWKGPPHTLRELAFSARAHGPRTYLVYEDERTTYEEAFQRAAAFATRLREELGVAKGDRVALAMRNFPEWPIAFFGAASIGAIVVPLNAWWKGTELSYALADAGARVLICDEERLRLVTPHLETLPIEHVIVARHTESLPDRTLSMAALCDTQRMSVDFPSVDIAPEDDATLFYTSGTTGHPKGALGTHRNMCTNIGSSLYTRARALLRRGDALPAPGTLPQAAQLVSVPFFHVTGSHSVMGAGTFTGAKLVMMHRWNPERALELIELERITAFGGVPSMVWQVLESPDFARRDTSSVMSVGYGGAPAAPELVRRIKEAFPTSSASNGYGLTETSAITTANAGVDYERKPDSVGVPMPICDVKVMDDAGHELPIGSVGELWIRGPNVVRGYWNKPEATEKSFSDGFLHTGDLARIDDEGFVYILDRAKDMLIRGGENVYCVEIEDVLYGHPSVMDAAVLGIPHRVLGEEVGVVVQLVAGATTSAEELQRYTAERLAAFKVPVRVEIRYEPLPRNPNGKIMKRDLKRELGWL